MKKISALTLVICLSLANICIAQRTKGDNRSLLWRISSKGMNEPSYLFGTIHMICPEDYFWTDSMEACLQRTKEVCFEMDISNQQVKMQVAIAMIDMSGKKLKDYFTDEQYNKLEKFFRDSLDMDLSTLSQIKPVALESIFLNSSANCKNPVMYEEKISEKAEKDHKTISGLEEPKEEIELLEKIPIDTVIKELLSMTEDNSESRGEYQKLVKAYKKQDLPALYVLINEAKGAGIDMAAFVDKRNKKWIERMVDKMDQGAVFFAVGAGHLWGEKGVIKLLREKGYKVEPVQ